MSDESILSEEVAELEERSAERMEKMRQFKSEASTLRASLREAVECLEKVKLCQCNGGCDDCCFGADDALADLYERHPELAHKGEER